MSAQRILLVSLIGLASFALLVGVVSGTLLRHVIQIIPIVIVVALHSRRPASAAYSSIPVFAFWLFAMTMIWLFLLGVSRLASGRYTLTEIVSTVFMAGFSVTGIVAAIRVGKPARWPRRVALFVLFAILQLAVMWVSFQPAFANR